ncbi:hypothetical protein ABK040_008943 [Willaertia magna]
MTKIDNKKETSYCQNYLLYKYLYLFYGAAPPTDIKPSSITGMINRIYSYSLEGITSIYLTNPNEKFVGLFCLNFRASSGTYAYEVCVKENDDWISLSSILKSKEAVFNGSTTCIVETPSFTIPNGKKEEEECQFKLFMKTASSSSQQQLYTEIYYFRILPLTIWEEKKELLQKNYNNRYRHCVDFIPQTTFKQ